MPSYNGCRPKQPIRAKGIVLEVRGRCSGVRNDPTGVEGQWGSQTQRLPTYCRLDITDTIARLARRRTEAESAASGRNSSGPGWSGQLPKRSEEHTSEL